MKGVKSEVKSGVKSGLKLLSSEAKISIKKSLNEATMLLKLINSEQIERYLFIKGVKSGVKTRVKSGVKSGVKLTVK